MCVCVPWNVNAERITVHKNMYDDVLGSTERGTGGGVD